MAKVAKVIKLVASSEKSWDDAAKVAVKEASKTIKNITGLKVLDMTAQVNDGIVNYKLTVEIAFGVGSD